MLIYLSCAKTMTHRTSVEVPFTTAPAFESEAVRRAQELARFSPEELGQLLRISPKLAAENGLRYRNFLSAEPPALPALLSYTGMVFKHIRPADFRAADFRFAQDRLLIASFLYGLLRPLDRIKNYRLEGSVRLPEEGGLTCFHFWKPLLTEPFIEAVRRQGGTLVNLASAEMKDLLDWKRVCREVQVITPEFYTLKNGKLTTVTVYAKMCRGEMTRFLLLNRIEEVQDLQAFGWEGFRFRGTEENGSRWIFVAPS